jgi:DNA topoisomerase VI subunit B
MADLATEMKAATDARRARNEGEHMSATASKNTPRLARETFTISRETEFFTEKELEMQVGHGRDWWPVALIKELIDNALDACESAEVSPDIEIEVAEDGFAVADNGPGIPEEVIARSLDFMQRVSDKALYVSPTRGQLGNALKTVWAAPYVANGNGRVEVETGGRRHVIEVSLDEIAQRPQVSHTVQEGALVRNGTRVRVCWPDSGCLMGEAKDDDFYESPPTARELVEGYAAFNPHATFRFSKLTFEATDPDSYKWRADELTSAHWYTPETLRSLIAGYIAREREGARARTVREFVSEFRGLSSTAKQKQATEGFSRTRLADLVEDGRFDDGAVGQLLARMQELSRPVKPAALGVIGQKHLAAWMVAHAGVALDSVEYGKKQGEHDGLPFVIEFAVGVRQDDNAGRRVLCGLNWAPALGTPVAELTSLLQEARVDPHDPVTMVLHIARPRFEFTDHGKGKVAL